jgi:CTD nuclear envelope phosphatase 1
MNSLNILSTRVIGPTPPTTPRSQSYAELPKSEQEKLKRRSSFDSGLVGRGREGTGETEERDGPIVRNIPEEEEQDEVDEKTPLIDQAEDTTFASAGTMPSSWRLIPKRIAAAFLAALKWALQTLAAPGYYFISCLFDHEGRFSPFLPLWKTGQLMGLTNYPEVMEDGVLASSNGGEGVPRYGLRNKASSSSIGSTSSVLTSESDLDEKSAGSRGSPSRRTRSKSSSASEEEWEGPRRSIRIKLSAEEPSRTRRSKQSKSTDASRANSATPEDIADMIKSPTSPASAMKARYPRNMGPVPPRPLIPRRQPSYTSTGINLNKNGRKTLILDLDETLIHSQNKGGRTGTGKMIEVKLNTPIGLGGGASIGPQHPILYYVHKRPHCDEFLRKVKLRDCAQRCSYLYQLLTLCRLVNGTI